MISGGVVNYFVIKECYLASPKTSYAKQGAAFFRYGSEKSARCRQFGRRLPEKIHILEKIVTGPHLPACILLNCNRFLRRNFSRNLDQFVIFSENRGFASVDPFASSTYAFPATQPVATVQAGPCAYVSWADGGKIRCPVTSYIIYDYITEKEEMAKLWENWHSNLLPGRLLAGNMPLIAACGW